MIKKQKQDFRNGVFFIGKLLSVELIVLFYKNNSTGFELYGV
ncbi:hypothetical protein [Chryseobacterium pennae]|nr:hypothetical protein [Chryseobacterium pennae]